MYSGDQQKPFGRFDSGPDTAPQLRLAYHGQGTPHQMVSTSNPVSWLVSLTQCFPFLNILSANKDTPVDAGIVEELDTGEVPTGVLAGGGSIFFSGNIAAAMPNGAVNPRMDTTVGGNPIPIVGYAPSGVPLGEMPSGKQVALFGSRKTLGVPYTPNLNSPTGVGQIEYK